MLAEHEGNTVKRLIPLIKQMMKYIFTVSHVHHTELVSNRRSGHERQTVRARWADLSQVCASRCLQRSRSVHVPDATDVIDFAYSCLCLPTTERPCLGPCPKPAQQVLQNRCTMLDKVPHHKVAAGSLEL